MSPIALYWWIRWSVRFHVMLVHLEMRVFSVLLFGGRLTAILMRMFPCLLTRSQHGVCSGGTTRVRLDLCSWKRTPGLLRQLGVGCPGLGPTEASWRLP